MEVIISPTYQVMSQKCVHDFLEIVLPLERPVICIASGDTPKGMYEELLKKIEEDKIDVSGWYFVGLDEWAGMNGNDEGSCRFHLNNQLFHPLKIAEDKIIFFDGRSKNLQAQCDGIEDYIDLLGGIDVAILGLGMNGHVGMNEPGTSGDLRSHISQLAETTQQVGQKYFKAQQSLTHGLTLGIASLNDAGNIMLLANGSKKAQVVMDILATEKTSRLPATLLTDHKNLRVYLDKDAAALTGLKDKV